jgi:hypothetical protein
MTFESMVSETVKKAVREAVTEELRKLPSLLPAAVSDAGWFEEEEFRRRFGLKSRDGLMAAVKAGTVERKALSARNHICRLRILDGEEVR